MTTWPSPLPGRRFRRLRASAMTPSLRAGVAFGDARGDVSVDLLFDPAARALAHRDWLRELARGHQLVNRTSRKTRLSFDRFSAEHPLCHASPVVPGGIALSDRDVGG